MTEEITIPLWLFMLATFSAGMGGAVVLDLIKIGLDWLHDHRNRIH